MRYLLTGLLFTVTIISCAQTFYVVRHAEKEVSDSTASMMSNNPTLSKAGKQRAEALKELLKTDKIGYIFSTNTIRTLSTVEPVKNYFNLATEIYQPVPDEAFISRLLSLEKNVLIVGHSNTVDDIVNKLCGAVKISSDLTDKAYDNLFVIRKKGKKMIFENRKYGSPSP
jgi:phosphohistidine phosphatase SixA